MTVKPPPIDPRPKERLVREFLARAPFYLGEWNPNAGNDPAGACVRIFVEMFDKVRKRLNRMPEKSLAAFLQTLGIDTRQARPARAWVAFTATPGAPCNAMVPAGSEMSGKGKGPGGGEEDMPFQTLRDLAVSPAALKELVSVRAASDAVYRAAVGENGGEIEPFSGPDEQEHCLYIAHPDLFNISQKGKFLIDFGLRTGVQKDIAGDGTGKWFQWEHFDKITGKWVPLGGKPSDGTNDLANGGIMEIEKSHSGEIAETEVAGAKDRWIRCRALPGLTEAAPKVLPEITSIKVSVASSGEIVPEMAFHNDVPLDIGSLRKSPDGEKPNPAGDPDGPASGKSSPNTGNTGSEQVVKPFGDSPVTGDIFYCACDEAFSKKNATVTVTMSLAQNGAPPYTVTAVVGWEYWNGATRTWRPLAPAGKNGLLGVAVKESEGPSASPQVAENRESVEINLPEAKVTVTMPARSIEVAIPPKSVEGAIPAQPVTITLPEKSMKIDGTLKPVQCTGTLHSTKKERSGFYTLVLTFQCPADIDKVKVNGEEKYWIRGRILEGDYGKPFELVNENSVNTVKKTEIHFPVIQSVNISYASTPELPVRCVSRNNAAFADHLHLLERENRAFAPFEMLPDKSDALYFGFDKPLVGGPLRVYFRLKNESEESPEARSEWSYWDGNGWEKLDAGDSTGGLRRNGSVEFHGSGEIAERSLFGLSRYWLKATIPGASFPKDLSFEGIFPNAVEAVQSCLIADEMLGAGDATADQVFHTVHLPVIAQDLWVLEPSEPDEKAMEKIRETGLPRPCEPAAETGPSSKAFWVHWRCVDDFDSAGPDDRCYTIDRRTGAVRFGNGEKGMVAPKGDANIKISYRFGGGEAGNVEAGAISTMVSTISYVDKVRNPFKAGAGAEAETPERALPRGAESLQHRNRAVTTEDFERMALMSGDVARARCLANIDHRGNPRPGWISVLIMPAAAGRAPEPDEELRAAVRETLERACVGTITAGKRLSVRAPRFIRISVEAALIPKKGGAVAAMADDAVDALKKFLDPITGGPCGKGWEFGETVYASAILALLMAVPGVDRVAKCRMSADDVYHENEIRIPPDAVTLSGDHYIELGNPQFTGRNTDVA